ncbi:MAG TPA: helix-turn-helix transcriptional regulator [Mycobacterium sp.]|uniref:helix-turn-helix transcriptional regulator n=1 Tax=Mycobacterium sp. TaxID=1785 RepID=UPI002F3E4B7B
MTRLVPESALSRRDWLEDIGAAEVRRLCGISQQTIAEALGVSQVAVCLWETGRRVPLGRAGAAYCRVIRALARHLAVEIPEGEQSAAPLSLAA